jgi:hypothetical protein
MATAEDRTIPPSARATPELSDRTPPEAALAAFPQTATPRSRSPRETRVETVETMTKRAAFAAKVVQKTPTSPIDENHA